MIWQISQKAMCVVHCGMKSPRNSQHIAAFDSRIHLTLHSFPMTTLCLRNIHNTMWSVHTRVGRLTSLPFCCFFHSLSNSEIPWKWSGFVHNSHNFFPHFVTDQYPNFKISAHILWLSPCTVKLCVILHIFALLNVIEISLCMIQLITHFTKLKTIIQIVVRHCIYLLCSIEQTVFDMCKEFA
jgi:hypothetical protein